MHNPKSNQKHVSLRLATLARNSINRIPGTLSPRKTTPLRLIVAAKSSRKPKRQQKSETRPKKDDKTKSTVRNGRKASPNTTKTTNIEQPVGSAARFCGTTELLEQVLLHNGTLKELISLRRVCKKWQAVIEGTPSLQRILFLAPQPSDHEWHGDYRSNPFWRNRCSAGPIESLLEKKPEGTAPEAGKAVHTSARINPLLFYKQPGHASLPIWQPHKYDYRVAIANDWNSQEIYLRVESKPNGIKTNSPLLQMFATQPPLETMILRVYDSGFRASARDIRNAKGVKVIDVLRAAEQLEGRKVVVVEDTIFPSEDQETIRIKSHRDDFPHFTKYRLD